MPHSQTKTAQTFKEVVALRHDLAVALPGTAASDAIYGHFLPGTVMGKVTSTGKLRRVTRAPVKTAGAFTTGAATGSVVGASAIFKIGDVLVVASSGAAMGTILTVVGDLITLTANSTTALAAGLDLMTSSGGGVAVGILVQDVNALLADQDCAVYVAGYFFTDQLIGMTAQALTELGGVTLSQNVTKL